VALLISLTLFPWLSAADAPVPPQREANRRRLSEMTVTERDRLDKNYQRYREMTPAERDRLLKLHRQIEGDPDLKAAFDEYQRWADSLSPVDRHELRQTQDPEARKQLIERFRRRPPPDEMPGSLPLDRPGDVPPFVQNRDNPRQRTMDRLFDGLALPIADRLGTGVPEMKAVLRVLEQELTAEQRDEVKKLDDYSREVRVLRLSLEKRPLGLPSVRLFGTGGELIDKIFAALPEGQFRMLVSNRNFPMNPRPNQPDPRGAMLLMVTVRGLITETLRTIDDHRPRNDQLLAHLEKLTESEKKRLRNLNPRERDQELAMLFVKDQVPGIAELQQVLGNPDLRRFLEDMANRLRPGAGPPGEERRDKNGRPLPFDGTRRPRDSEPPFNRPEPKD